MCNKTETNWKHENKIPDTTVGMKKDALLTVIVWLMIVYIRLHLERIFLIITMEVYKSMSLNWIGKIKYLS